MGIAPRLSHDEPRFPSFFRGENRERSIYRVTKHVKILVLSSIDRVEKSVLVRVGEHQLPRMAAISRFVEARQITFAARHHNSRVRIEGLDAAEVKMLGVPAGSSRTAKRNRRLRCAA